MVMEKYVAFLRGINVGGHKLVKMEALRQIFESLGFKDVSTYIQSGNVIFVARATNLTSLKKKIEKALKAELGHEVIVAVVPLSEVVAIVKADPFKGIEASKDVALYVAFFCGEATARPPVPFTDPKEYVDLIGFHEHAAFIVAHRKPNGQHGFPGGFMENQFGVSGTTRNMNTVTKIAAFADAKAPIDAKSAKAR